MDPPQHLAALERANAVRLGRAAIKRKVESGELRVADVLRDVPPVADGMQIIDLLMAQERWGRTRSLKVLRLVPLRENKRLGDMTERQRGFLAAMLPGCRTMAAAQAAA